MRRYDIKTQGGRITAWAGVALAVLLATGAGLLWWWQSGSREVADVAVDGSAAVPSVPPVATAGGDAESMATGRSADDDASTAAPGRPTAPARPAAETIAALAERLGDYRDPEARVASAELIGRGSEAADDVLAVLQDVSRREREARATGASPREVGTLAARKLQLVVVMGAIGAPRHADALIAIARASEPGSLAHQNVAIALGRMGAADAARAYAHEVLSGTGLSAVQARAMLGHLVHFPDAGDAALARRLLSTPGNEGVRDLALLLAARSGLKDEVRALAPSVVATATTSGRDFYSLLALAEALPPEEFQRIAEGSPLASARPLRRYYEQALMHSRFVWSDEAGKLALLERQLSLEESEPVIAALKFVLQSGRSDWLIDHGIVADVRAARLAAGLTVGDVEQLKVVPRYVNLLGFTGYRIDVSGTVPQVEPLGGSGP